MATVTQGVAPDESSALAGSEVAYLIVYVEDLDRSRSFYEGQLCLRPVDIEEASAMYDTGDVRLWLRRAVDDGVELPGHTDDSCDVVFLVEDAIAYRRVVEQRGIQVSHQRTYGVGTVVDFYDPDGHRLMLYEPSEHALVNTPVGDDVRAIWARTGRGGTGIIGPPAGPLERDASELGLDGKPLLYFFLFIRDLHEMAGFFERQLGLPVMERSHCCSDGCPDGEPGVVKYDGGEIILSTHHMHGHHSVLDDDGQPYAARDYEPQHAKGVAVVFRVNGIEQVKEQLEARDIRFTSGVRRVGAALVAPFEAPSGHLFYLYEARAA